MMNQKGLTLIELIVVIAIIGLLSTLSVVALNSAREAACHAAFDDGRYVGTDCDRFRESYEKYGSFANSREPKPKKEDRCERYWDAKASEVPIGCLDYWDLELDTQHLPTLGL